MTSPTPPIVLVLAPELSDDELRAAFGLLNQDELQKIIQAVYATAGGLQ